MLEQMRFFEARDVEDRTDGTPRMQRLRQISPETGNFLALLAAGAPEDHIIEVGTASSALWLALVTETSIRCMTAPEVLPEKATLARATFRLTSVDRTVERIADDAPKHIERVDEIAFCFLDAEKEVYGQGNLDISCENRYSLCPHAHGFNAAIIWTSNFSDGGSHLAFRLQ